MVSINASKSPTESMARRAVAVRTGNAEHFVKAGQTFLAGVVKPNPATYCHGAVRYPGASMPLTPPQPREAIHTRSIEINGIAAPTGCTTLKRI